MRVTRHMRIDRLKRAPVSFGPSSTSGDDVPGHAPGTTPCVAPSDHVPRGRDDRHCRPRFGKTCAAQRFRSGSEPSTPARCRRLPLSPAVRGPFGRFRVGHPPPPGREPQARHRRPTWRDRELVATPGPQVLAGRRHPSDTRHSRRQCGSPMHRVFTTRGRGRERDDAGAAGVPPPEPGEISLNPPTRW